MTTQVANNAPQEIEDADLDQASGGYPFGKTYDNLKPLAVTLHFSDNQPSHKIVLAQASGSGNVTGNGGAPAPDSYTFHEDIGNEFIPVTYKLVD